MKNLSILKEAMADAKSLQEVAIRNAKKTLEENFTPHLKSMLAKKLEEMESEEMESEEMESEEMESEEMEENLIHEDEIEEEMSIDDILAEIDAMDDDLNEAEDSKEKDSEKKDDSKEDEKPEEEEAENEEEVSIEDMSEEDLKSFIEEVIEDMVKKGELEPGETTEDKPLDDSMNDDMDLGFDLEDDEMFSDDDEEINIDSLLEEYENDDELLSDNIEEGIDATELTKIAQSTGMSLDAVKALIALAGFIGVPALSALAIVTKEGVGKLFDMLKSKADTEAVAEEEELMENLRKQLKETKLLNSKLFYTVEIFNASKTTLNETQRLGVLKAFDKATSVKEVKLVYETLKDKFTSKNPLQERKMGSASKVITNTTKKTAINEGIIDNQTIKRLQKLAGI